MRYSPNPLGFKFLAVVVLSSLLGSAQVVAAKNKTKVSLWSDSYCGVKAIFTKKKKILFTDHSRATIPASCTTVDLGMTKMKDQGAVAIAKALMDNVGVTNLIMYNNAIGPRGARALGQLLGNNTGLTMLNLDNNHIGKRGAKWISDGLKSNTKLTNLDLVNNDIKDVGAGSLAEALKINRGLKYLNIASNKINNNGTTAIAEALSLNENLHTLSISGNKFGNVGAAAIAKAVHAIGKGKKGALKTLKLDGNNFGKQALADLREAKGNNNQLTMLKLFGKKKSKSTVQA